MNSKIDINFNSTGHDDSVGEPRPSGNPGKTEFCCSSLTTRQMLASQLRDMSFHVSDYDRCTLCKAAEELSKIEQATHAWVFTLFKLASMWDGKTIDPNELKELIKSTEKEQEIFKKE